MSNPGLEIDKGIKRSPVDSLRSFVTDHGYKVEFNSEFSNLGAEEKNRVADIWLDYLSSLSEDGLKSFFSGRQDNMLVISADTTYITHQLSDGDTAETEPTRRITFGLNPDFKRISDLLNSLDIGWNTSDSFALMNDRARKRILREVADRLTENSDSDLVVALGELKKREVSIMLAPNSPGGHNGVSLSEDGKILNIANHFFTGADILRALGLGNLISVKQEKKQEQDAEIKGLKLDIYQKLAGVNVEYGLEGDELAEGLHNFLKVLKTYSLSELQTIKERFSNILITKGVDMYSDLDLLLRKERQGSLRVDATLPFEALKRNIDILVNPLLLSDDVPSPDIPVPEIDAEDANPDPFKEGVFDQSEEVKTGIEKFKQDLFEASKDLARAEFDFNKSKSPEDREKMDEAQTRLYQKRAELDQEVLKNVSSRAKDENIDGANLQDVDIKIGSIYRRIQMEILAEERRVFLDEYRSYSEQNRERGAKDWLIEKAKKALGIKGVQWYLGLNKYKRTAINVAIFSTAVTVGTFATGIGAVAAAGTGVSMGAIRGVRALGALGTGYLTNSQVEKRGIKTLNILSKDAIDTLEKEEREKIENSGMDINAKAKAYEELERRITSEKKKLNISKIVATLAGGVGGGVGTGLLLDAFYGGTGSSSLLNNRSGRASFDPSSQNGRNSLTGLSPKSQDQIPVAGKGVTEEVVKPIELVPPAQEMMPQVAIQEMFGNTEAVKHIVEAGDSQWKLLEKTLENYDKYKQLSSGEGQSANAVLEAKRTYVISMLNQEIQKDPSQYGVDADGLKVGDKVDYTKLFENKALVDRAINEAENLKPNQIENIIKNNAQVKNWVEKHSGEALDESKVSEIISNDTSKTSGGIKSPYTESSGSTGSEGVDNEEVNAHESTTVAPDKGGVEEVATPQAAGANATKEAAGEVELLKSSEYFDVYKKDIGESLVHFLELKEQILKLDLPQNVSKNLVAKIDHLTNSIEVLKENLNTLTTESYNQQIENIANEYEQLINEARKAISDETKSRGLMEDLSNEKRLLANLIDNKKPSVGNSGLDEQRNMIHNEIAAAKERLVALQSQTKDNVVEMPTRNANLERTMYGDISDIERIGKTFEQEFRNIYDQNGWLRRTSGIDTKEGRWMLSQNFDKILKFATTGDAQKSGLAAEAINTISGSPKHQAFLNEIRDLHSMAKENGIAITVAPNTGVREGMMKLVESIMRFQNNASATNVLPKVA